jgi:hypothetical protein
VIDGHDRNPVKEKAMTNDSIENNSFTPASEGEKTKRKPANKAKLSKKAAKAKEQAKPNAERASKKAEVLAMLVLEIAIVGVPAWLTSSGPNWGGRVTG